MKKEKERAKRVKEPAAAGRAPTAERDGGDEARAAKRARKEARRRERALEEAQDDDAGMGGTAVAAAEEEAPGGAADGALEEWDEGDGDGAGSAALAQLGWRGRRAFWKDVAAEVNAQLSDVRGPRPRPQIKEKVYTIALSRKGSKVDSATRGKVGRPRYLLLTTCRFLLTTHHSPLATHHSPRHTRWAGRVPSPRRSLIGSSICATGRS